MLFTSVISWINVHEELQQTIPTDTEIHLVSSGYFCSLMRPFKTQRAKHADTWARKDLSCKQQKRLKASMGSIICFMLMNIQVLVAFSETTRKCNWAGAVSVFPCLCYAAEAHDIILTPKGNRKEWTGKASSQIHAVRGICSVCCFVYAIGERCCGARKKQSFYYNLK